MRVDENCLMKVEVISIRVFKKSEKIYVYKTSLTLKTITLLHLRYVVDQTFNPLVPGGNKKVRQLKQTCSFQLQVCLSMCDLFVTTRH